jgi:hypothetical protein
MSRTCTVLALIVTIWLQESLAGEEPPPKDTRAPELAKLLDAPTAPYVFNLGGLTQEEIDKLNAAPWVQSVEVGQKRVRVVWQPYEWKPKRKAFDGCNDIYDFLVLKGRIGKTEWTHGGNTSGRAGAVIFDQYRAWTFGMMFNDLATGHNEIMSLKCYSEPESGQVEHEMLRDAPGTKTTIEKCGEGYVIVSRAGRGIFVVWQVSEQMFVRIDNSYDKEMVAAYVNRLGSTIPKDYKISVDRWVENEIRWRMKQIDRSNGWDRPQPGRPAKGSAGIELWGKYVWMFFPEVVRIKGRCDFEKMDPMARWEWLNWTRNWLWANRTNFKYDDVSRGYILKGKNLYDTDHPPDLPEEIKGPPRPTPEEVKTMLEYKRPDEDKPSPSPAPTEKTGSAIMNAAAKSDVVKPPFVPSPPVNQPDNKKTRQGGGN